MKGQAALEYLFTYGWAIFVLLLVTAFLFTGGYLSPERFIAEECSISPNFPCDFVFVRDAEGGKLLLKITNGFSYPVRINSVVFSAQGTEESVENRLGRIVESGDSLEINARLRGRFVEGQIYRFMLNVSYSSCAPELGDGCGATHHVLGRITARAVEE